MKQRATDKLVYWNIADAKMTLEIYIVRELELNKPKIITRESEQVDDSSCITEV